VHSRKCDIGFYEHVIFAQAFVRTESFRPQGEGGSPIGEGVPLGRKRGTSLRQRVIFAQGLFELNRSGLKSLQFHAEKLARL